ncbi:MAG: TonB-dependent receptor [Novosphingobium sp.]
MRHHLLSSTLLAAGVLLAVPAAAQDAPASSAPADASQAPDNGVGDIVVTAQRRSESIQAVPIAVSALSSAQLASPTISGIKDIAGRVPGLIIDTVSSGPKAAAISIRGISFDDIEKSFDPAVGVVVDGVFIGTNTGQLLDSFDLSGLEVLRGPQGTLFGRNTIGGVVNVTRTKPTGQLGGKFSFGYSSFNTKTGKAVINLPSIGGLIALKGFAYYDQTDGYYFNATLNRRAGKDKSISGGVTALITPSSNIEALITYEHSSERGETVGSSLSNSSEVLCNAFLSGFLGTPLAPANQCNRNSLPDHGLYTIFQQIETPLRNDSNSVSANINVTLGNFKLTSVTGWQSNKEDLVQDFDATSVQFFETHRPQTYRQFSQELRIAGDVTPWLNALLGAYYFKSQYNLSQTSHFGAGLAGAGFPAIDVQQDTKGDAKSYAVFSDLQIKPTDRLTIGLGARWTHDDKAIFNDYGQVPFLVRLTQPNWNGQCVQVVGLLAPGVPAYGPANNCTFSKGFSKFTYRATASYEVADAVRVFGSVSRGYRSGGFNGRAGSPTSVGPYQPEVVDAFELGLKADWLDHKLRTNFSVFQNNYKNKQEEVVQPSPPGAANPQETVIQNAANARVRGFEAEITARPTSDLTLTGSLSYLDGKYINFFKDVNGDNVADNVSTLTLRRAPHWTYSVGADYVHEMASGTVHANVLFRHVSPMQTCIVPAAPVVLGQVTNDPRCLSNSRNNLDASIGYTVKVGDAEVDLTVYGRNLTDNRGISGVLPVAGLMTFGIARSPRSFGVQAQVKF